MKRFYLLLSAIFFIYTANSYADDQLEDIGSENIDQSIEDANDGRPFKIDVMGDWVGRAKVKNSDGLHKVLFATGMAEASYVYYYNPCIEEGANVSLFYENTYLDWKSNPYFNQRNVNTVGVNLGLFSKRMQDWTWNTQVSINFDNVEHWNINDYMYYDVLLWGRYEYCPDLGIHIGFLANTGMKINRVYPVIGFDFKYNRYWKFNVIFPMNISIVYSFNEAWSVSIAGRFFNERHRVKKEEWLSCGLYRYQTAGAELGLTYAPNMLINANIHAGINLGGRLTIADRHYRHSQRIRLNPAPYAGGEVTVNF